MAKSLSISESFYFPHNVQSLDEHDDEEEEEEEHEQQVAENSSQAKQNLGVTILASRFAANTKRGAQKVRDLEMHKLQKPEEPDFSADAEED